VQALVQALVQAWEPLAMANEAAVAACSKTTWWMIRNHPALQVHQGRSWRTDSACTGA